MIKKLLIFALVLVAGLSVAELARQDPGYLLINYKDWIIETSLIVVFIAGILLASLMYIVYLIARPVNRVTNKFLGIADENTKLKKADQTFHRGLLSLSDGDWKNAESLLGKAASKSSFTVVAFLGAARAAYELGKNSLCEKYLSKAMAFDKKNNHRERQHILLFKGQIALGESRFEDCLEMLQSLNTQQHGSTYLKLKIRALVELKKWHQVFALLNEARESGVLGDNELVKIESASLAAVIENQPLETVNNYWKQIPSKRQNISDIASVYFSALLKNKAHNHAEALAKKQIQKGTDLEWAQLYAQLPNIEAQTKLNYLQKYLGHHSKEKRVKKTLDELELQVTRNETSKALSEGA